MVGGSFSEVPASTQAVRDGAGGVVFLGLPPAGSGPSIKRSLAQLEHGAATPLFTATDEEGGGWRGWRRFCRARCRGPVTMAGQWTPGRADRPCAQAGRQGTDAGARHRHGPRTGGRHGERRRHDRRRGRPLVQRAGRDRGRGTPWPSCVASRRAAWPASSSTSPVSGTPTPTPTSPLPPTRRSPWLAGDDPAPFRAAIGAGVRVVMMSNVTEPDWGDRAGVAQPGGVRLLALG